MWTSLSQSAFDFILFVSDWWTLLYLCSMTVLHMLYIRFHGTFKFAFCSTVLYAPLYFIFFFALFRAATLFALEFIELSLKCVNYSILSSELRNSARLCRSLAKQWKIMREKEAVNGAVFVEKVINIKHSPH